MSRLPSFSSPFLLGFEEIERALDRIAKAGDSYPPYNIERVARDGDRLERLRITLAVAGFSRDELEVMVEENEERVFLHRGIAARQFQRTFVLADGMQVVGAELRDGLLSVDLERPETERVPRRIDIAASK